MALLGLLGATLIGCERDPMVKTLQSPNVIVILSDDQGWGDLSIHGNPYLETPHIDQLAHNGLQHTNFYVNPLCAPTRASLLTGRYNLRTGTRWVSSGLENMRPEEFTLAELFKSANYATGCFGKWHNGAHYPFHPNQQGFDEFIGFCAGHWNNYFNTTLEHNGEEYSTEGYITDVLTDEAITFIEKNQQQPFFCYLPYNVPHGPFQVGDTYYDKYYAMLDTMQHEQERQKLAAVYGMCENLDDNVGRIVSTLDSLSLLENTIIIYLTDNGPNGSRYNGGMRGTKGSTHEGGSARAIICTMAGAYSGGSSARSNRRSHRSATHAGGTLRDSTALHPGTRWIEPGCVVEGRAERASATNTVFPAIRARAYPGSWGIAE